MKDNCNSRYVHENIVELVESFGYSMEVDKSKKEDYYVKIPKKLISNDDFLIKLIDLEIDTINYRPKNLNGASYSGYHTWQGAKWTITNIDSILDNNPIMLERKFFKLLNLTSLNGWYIIMYEFTKKGLSQINMASRAFFKWGDLTSGHEGKKIHKLVYGTSISR